LVVCRNRAGEAVIATIAKLAPEDIPLERGDIDPMKVRRIRKHLRDHRTSRLRIARKLDLDHRQAPNRLDGHEVCIAATERNFPANHHQLRRPGQWEELRSFFDQAVQRRFVSEASGRKQTPARAVVTPQRRQSHTSLKDDENPHQSAQRCSPA